MTDLETRVRDTLTGHAGTAGEWRVPGEVLREAAADRASSRRRRAAVAAGALVVAGVVGVAAWSGDGPRNATPTDPSPSPSESEGLDRAPGPEAAWLQVPLTDAMFTQAIEAAGVDSSWRPLASARVPGIDDVVVMLSDMRPGFPVRDRLAVVTVTFDSDKPDAQVRGGTRGTYDSLADVIAQPARAELVEGDAVLLVLTPPTERTVATAVFDAPGRRLAGTSATLETRMSVIPLLFGRPEDVVAVVLTGEGSERDVHVLPARAGTADWSRPPDVVASEGSGTPQVVQVRSDGSVACRMTVGSWWDGPPQLPWNPFDVACTTIDNEGLQLLLADDRRYSSVTGVAPVGTATVRLTWRSGSDTDVTETPVRNQGEDVHAFIDESGHRPDHLTKAEALDADGDVVATALP